jgi:predicted Zn-dependent protease
VRIFAPAAALLLAIAPSAGAQTEPLADLLAAELRRNFDGLKAKADPAPYFLSYAVTERETEAVSAALGALQSGGARSRSRALDISLRVGDPQLDNYRRIRGDLPNFASGAAFPLNDVPNAVRRRLWLETDRVYRLAAQRLINIKTNQQVKVAEATDVPDFSPAPMVTAMENVPALKFNRAEWEKKLKVWSAEFANQPGILASNVTLLAQREVKWFVSTEGTRLRHGRTFARLVISAQGKAADGMDLATTDSFEAEDPSRLPDEKRIRAAVTKVREDLLKLLKAPTTEPYIGPAILSGRAAGVFFHEIFGHRVEGHRQKEETEGQTFANQVGQPILPDFLSVVFDPTRRALGGVDLNGWYQYDDEGVRGQRVVTVENGILKTFLTSRSPLKNVPASNGHGRRQPGAEPISRQSNLIVESSKAVPFTELRQQLLAEVRKQNKPYGLYFEVVSSGFTMTGRRGLQAFSVVPLVVWRVYPDGRPDELVRGVDIVGTPLASFSKIIATAAEAEVFNGYCGAESGQVPVSAVSPALLVREVEIQKKEKSQDTPPILSRPMPATEARP